MAPEINMLCYSRLAPILVVCCVRLGHICLLKRVFFLVIPFYQAFLGFLVYGAKSALQQGV